MSPSVSMTESFSTHLAFQTTLLPVIFCSMTLQFPSFSEAFGTGSFFVMHCVVVKGMGGTPGTPSMLTSIVCSHMPSFMSTAQTVVRTKNVHPHSIAPRAKPQYFVFIKSSFIVPLKNWMKITPDASDCQERAGGGRCWSVIASISW